MVTMDHDEEEERVYDHGHYTTGERVVIRKDSPVVGARGKTGRITRLDPGQPWPITVWLDEFKGRPIWAEGTLNGGLPVHAGEIDPVTK